jgi:hypothetical protein
MYRGLRVISGCLKQMMLVVSPVLQIRSPGKQVRSIPTENELKCDQKDADCYVGECRKEKARITPIIATLRGCKEIHHSVIAPRVCGSVCASTLASVRPFDFALEYNGVGSSCCANSVPALVSIGTRVCQVLTPLSFSQNTLDQW